MDRHQEALDKLLEIKKLLIKFGPPQKVMAMIANCWDAYCQIGKISVLDQVLTDARRLSRLNETMEQLNSDK